MFKFRLVSILSFLFLTGCMATQTYTADKAFTPAEKANIYEMVGKSKIEAYNASRQWFSEYFVSGESVIDYEDKEAGTIIGNGVSQIGSSLFVTESIKYSIRVDAKDGKIRVVTKVIDHRNWDSTNGTYIANYVSDDRVAKAEAAVESVAQNLKNYIMSGSENDW